MLGCTVSTESETRVTQLGLDFDTKGSPGRSKALNASSRHVWNDLFCLSCRPGSRLAGFTLGYIVASPSRFSPEHLDCMAS